jgi:hypothetical protein
LSATRSLIHLFFAGCTALSSGVLPGRRCACSQVDTKFLCARTTFLPGQNFSACPLAHLRTLFAGSTMGCLPAGRWFLPPAPRLVFFVAPRIRSFVRLNRLWLDSVRTFFLLLTRFFLAYCIFADRAGPHFSAVSPNIFSPAARWGFFSLFLLFFGRASPTARFLVHKFLLSCHAYACCLHTVRFFFFCLFAVRFLFSLCGSN